MVFIQRTQYQQAYSRILQSSRPSAPLAPAFRQNDNNNNDVQAVTATSYSNMSVLILVSPDPDALCACRMLVRLLQEDYVGYRVVPISGWREFGMVDEIIRNDTKLRTLILINLGSTIALDEYFDPLPPHLTFHIIDSHRPHNLNNIFLPEENGGGQVLVWDDGDIEDGLEDVRVSFLTLLADQHSSDSESGSDTESEEEDSDEEVEEWKRRRRRQLRNDLDSDDDDDASDSGSDSDSDEGRQKRRRTSEDDDGSGGGRRRRRRKKGKGKGKDREGRLGKREKQNHLNRVKKYYTGGTFFGQSVAAVVYVLANDLERGDNDLLWMAILGLTHQFTSNQIDRDRYDSWTTLLSDEVARFNPHPLPGLPSLLVSSSSTSADDRSIRPSEELRFMLFRHWNLYDSMYHSSYVAGKMKLWRERGKKNLQGFLAKMGFSLDQCRQTFTHMDMDLKRTLRHKVDSIAPEYGLVELSYPSFVRAFGFQSVLSAGDVVEGLGALLEVANGVAVELGVEFGVGPGGNTMAGVGNGGGGGMYSYGGGAGGGGMGQDTAFWKGGGLDKENVRPGGEGGAEGGGGRGEDEDAERVEEAKKAREEAWWVQNFWVAWDSLGYDHLLRTSLPLSMALHRAIIRQGTSILDKQSIKTLRSFRLAVLKEGPDLRIFNHPSTLSRLALWLVDTVRDLVLTGGGTGLVGGRERKKGLPFVVASLDESIDMFLVVGVTGAADFGDVKKNKFGLAFQRATESSGAKTRHDRFDASVVGVHKDDLQLFVDKLALELTSS